MNTPLGRNYLSCNARSTDPNRTLRNPHFGQHPLPEPYLVCCDPGNLVFSPFSQQHSFLRRNQQFPLAPQRQQVRNFSAGSNGRDMHSNNFHNKYRNCNQTTNHRFRNFRNSNNNHTAQMFHEGLVATTIAAAAATTAAATVTTAGIGAGTASGPTITAQVKMSCCYFPRNSGKMSTGEDYKNFSASEANRMKTTSNKNPAGANSVSNQHPGPESTIINNLKNIVNGLINPQIGRNFSAYEQNKYYNSPQHRNNSTGRGHKMNDIYSSTGSSSTGTDECSRRKPNSQSKTDKNSLLENRSYHPCNSAKTHRNSSSSNVKRNNSRKDFSRNGKIAPSNVDNICSPSQYSQYVDPKMESEIVAIFSKDDFPELPTPKRQIYQDLKKSVKSQPSVTVESLSGSSMGNLSTSTATSAIEINKQCSTNKKKKRRKRKTPDYCIEDSFVILPPNSVSNLPKLATSPSKSTVEKPPSTMPSASPPMSNTNSGQNVILSETMGNVISSLGSLSTSPKSSTSSPSTAAILSPVKSAASIFTKCLNPQLNGSNDEINKENFVNFLKIGSPPTFSCNRQRERQISECSDDSFIICFAENAAEGILEYSDTTDDDEDDTDTDTDDNDDISDEEDELSESENDSIEHGTDSDDDVFLEKTTSVENSKLAIKTGNTTRYHNPKNNCELSKGAKGVRKTANKQKKTAAPSTAIDDPNGLDQLDSGFEERKERKVRFDLEPEVHVMHTWDYAYRAARKGDWENFARDRLRFKHRIENLAETLNPVLEQKHRESIYNARFCDNLSSS